MSQFLFESFNNDFLFELPEGLWNTDNFKKIADAYEKYGEDTIEVIAFGINTIDKVKNPKAVSDRSGWIATEDELINVPEFQLPVLEKMMRESEVVDACKAGHMGAKIVPYENQYGEHLKFKWVTR